MDKKEWQILIIDLGSQYTEIIRRSLRYLGVHSVVISAENTLEYINDFKPKGIILSGGSASVYEPEAPQIPSEILNSGIPILGICFGMQWIAYMSDKDSVHRVQSGKSYGPVEINFSNKITSPLINELENTIKAWASHGDSVKKAPNDFEVFATSENGQVIEGMQNLDKNIFGVQFHPEVEQTEDNNKILANFIFNVCEVVKDYSKKEIVDEIRTKTLKELGDGVAIIGVSGGVDSTTLAAILAPTLGDRIKAFMIDTGGMREGEIQKVQNMCQKAGIDILIIDKYVDKFINEVGQTIDAEEKRAKFRKVYGEVFKEVAKEYNATHMIQGTLATDLIESGSKGNSAMIKTHHNVNLDLGLKEIMPLEDFFKFEVRDLAFEFGLEELVVKRQPFPGPGLFLRIVGVPVNKELLEIVREADVEVSKILEKYSVYEKISQVVVALLGVKTVGVKGDGRVYEYSIVVRPVETTDFMTVKGFYLREEICQEIIAVLTRHPKIARVFFDFTPKPPATTEFE
ncbi:MAG: glutamine-hydrolyzing GMP synthase [Candidatus Pacebacteria bacterium]|nr:glutamine-hydrolyzing GMP synthase [Candidatus Paceibacterota bacterium]MCF7862739.1 glutamine-hydrolyzing GMP synthase [Candidatus Paceibacterota bacterium]